MKRDEYDMTIDCRQCRRFCTKVDVLSGRLRVLNRFNRILARPFLLLRHTRQHSRRNVFLTQRRCWRSYFTQISSLITTSPSVRVRSIAISVFVCLSVCPSAYLKATRPNCTKFFSVGLHVTYGRGSASTDGNEIRHVFL